MPKNNKPSTYFERYGLYWEQLVHPVEVELQMIRRGGQWKTKQDKEVGNGLFFHYKRLQQLLDPEKAWHKWNDLLLKTFIENRIIACMGPASSGKTREAADFARMNYYVWFDQITVLLTSTERDRLEERVWGEIKSGHKRAKSIYDQLPGHLIESRQRLITDQKTVDNEGRDFRNGCVGLPSKKGGQFVGLGAFSGIKNKRVMLIADEAQFCPPAYLDAISNLNKNHEFKCIALGNPKDTQDALGKIAEPSAEIGGWEAGLDQTSGTKTWPTRFDQGICVQLVGDDSPNFDVPEDAPVPFPFLITRKAIEADIKFYGMDSLQFGMMDIGKMPRGQGSRRVITRPMCRKFQAMDQVIWKDEDQTKLACLDAAYGNTGGDRCIIGEINFGTGIVESKERQMLSLIDTSLVPVSAQNPELPEDQIALFCMDYCKNRNIPPERFFFDSTGRGTLMAAFARLWSPNVQPVEFGGKPTERIVSDAIKVKCCDYYSKFVSELWYSVRLIIESGQWRGMNEEALEELSIREWTMVTGNKVEVEPKKKTKERMGRSPDIADCVVSGVEGARRLGFTIAKLAAKASTALTNDFKKRLEARLGRLRRSYELTYS